MIFFDFAKNKIPNTNDPYLQKVILFVQNWQAGLETIEISTSGSTGPPKIIDLKRSQMIASAKLTGRIFGLGEGSHAFCCLNIDFIGGKMMLVRAMVLRMQITVIEPVNNPFLAEVTRKQYDFLALVPLQIENILKNDQTKKYLEFESGLKNIIIGGASINHQTQLEIEEFSILCFATYGMTETVSHIAIKQLNGKNKSENFEIFSVISTEVDERNCLKIKGECTDNQWIVTNDLVEMVSEKKFKLLGRVDRIVNSGGIKIFLDLVEKELEKDLIDYFSICYRYFLFGIPDDYLGEKLVLAIEAENLELKGNVKEVFKYSILDRYKRPKEIFFIDKFEETQSGKVDIAKTIGKLLTNQKFNKN